MRPTCNLYKTLAAGVVGLALPLGAAADMHGDAKQQDGQQQQHQQMHDKMHDKMHGKNDGQQAAGQTRLENAVSADSLLSGDVVNVANPIGSVRDLILNEDGTAVEYVLYEVPYPYAYMGGQDGFVAFDNVAIQEGAAFDTEMRIDDDASARTPDELELTRAEADHRMVSRILDDAVYFQQEQHARDVEDMLIDRKTGEVVGYVVNRSPDAWFNEEPLVVSPEDVTIEDDGNITTSAEFAALESLKR